MLGLVCSLAKIPNDSSEFENINWLNVSDRHCQSNLSSAYKFFDYKVADNFEVYFPARPYYTNTLSSF